VRGAWLQKESFPQKPHPARNERKKNKDPMPFPEKKGGGKTATKDYFKLKTFSRRGKMPLRLEKKIDLTSGRRGERRAFPPNPWRGGGPLKSRVGNRTRLDPTSFVRGKGPTPPKSKKKKKSPIPRSQRKRKGVTGPFLRKRKSRTLKK